ncbi:MAG: hypothetical protein KME08_05565 [Aphanothece sp. CMT-3BRIN-NPC111]|jgi:hypothetical protein|nr:hypothetical protein [Aphanothece sp. CMT-3BRIN-NPC111]
MNLSTKLMVVGLAVAASALSFASVASAQAVSAGLVLKLEGLSSETTETGSTTGLESLELSAAIATGENTIANLQVTHNGPDIDTYKAFAAATNGSDFNNNLTVSNTSTTAITDSVVTLGTP